jgi:hypothetical protein
LPTPALRFLVIPRGAGDLKGGFKMKVPIILAKKEDWIRVANLLDKLIRSEKCLEKGEARENFEWIIRWIRKHLNWGRK